MPTVFRFLLEKRGKTKGLVVASGLCGGLSCDAAVAEKKLLRKTHNKKTKKIPRKNLGACMFKALRIGGMRVRADLGVPTKLN